MWKTLGMGADVAQTERTFIENMTRLREEHGWNQSELARRMVAAGWETYSQMTVSRTEKFERPIRLSESHALASILGSTPEEMVSPANSTQANLRAWADFVSESYDGAGVHLVSLFDALQGLRETIETATDERLTAHVQQAKDALTMTPERALKEAKKLHALPLGAR